MGCCGGGRCGKIGADDAPPLQASFQAPDPALIGSLRFNEAGLIPAVAQDWLDGAVLMVAWMNREAIERTLASGEVHYWSRSRQELWHKGATSGHIQQLRGLRYDCDADVLLLTIEQRGDVADGGPALGLAPEAEAWQRSDGTALRQWAGPKDDDGLRLPPVHR